MGNTGKTVKRGRPRKAKVETPDEPKGDKSKHAGTPIPKGVTDVVLRLVSNYYLEGRSYRWIAIQIEEEIGQKLSFVTVGNYVARLLSEWKEERVGKLDDLKTIELTRIAKLENTYWEGWQRSLTATKRTSDKQRAQPGKKLVAGELVDTMNVKQAEKSEYTEENFGDPRFLDGIKWCIQMRCKLLGIEAPIEFKGNITSTVKRTTVFNTRTRNRPE